MNLGNKAIRRLEAWTSRIWNLPILFPKMAQPPDPKSGKILIVKACCFGDAIISLHAIAHFHDKYPQCQIDVLCTDRISEVYRAHSCIAEVYSLPIRGNKALSEILSSGFWGRLFKIIRALRKKNYIALYDLELYRGFPLFIKALLGVPYSHGFLLEGSPRKNHNHLVTRPKNLPEWKCFYNLFGLEEEAVSPKIILFPKQPSVGSFPATKRLGVVFGSSFNWPQKKWPLANFAEVIRTFHGKGYEIVLFGAPYEIEESVELEKLAGIPLENPTGKLGFQELVGKIHECTLVLGNDTGTMHLASACGVHGLTLFGPTNPDKWNSFLSTPYFIDIECRPCYYLSHMPDCSHINCLRQMEFHQVSAKLEKIAETLH